MVEREATLSIVATLVTLSWKSLRRWAIVLLNLSCVAGCGGNGQAIFTLIHVLFREVSGREVRCCSNSGLMGVRASSTTELVDSGVGVVV